MNSCNASHHTSYNELSDITQAEGYLGKDVPIINCITDTLHNQQMPWRNYKAFNPPWSTDVRNNVGYANRSLSYLKHNFSSLPTNLKRLPYIPLARSQLEIPSSIWRTRQFELTMLLDSASRMFCSINFLPLI